MKLTKAEPTTAAATSPAIRTELEASLASPQGTAVRNAYLARLHTLAACIHTRLSSGVNRADYVIGRALARAVDVASEILEQHPTIDPAPGRLPTPAAAKPGNPSSTQKR